MFDRCLYFNVNALARRVNAIWDEAFLEFNLSPAHAYLLRLLLETPGLTQTQITKELKLEKSTVTRFVTALEEKLLLTRDRHGREVLVFPTAKAYSIHEQLSVKGNDLYQQMIDALGQDGLTDLVASLRQSGKVLNKSLNIEEEVID